VALSAIPTTANAFTAPPGNGYWDFYKVKVIARYYDQVDFNHRIARVYQQPGESASISAGRSATRTIQVGGGYTRAGVAGSLSISSATTVTVTVGCTSVIPVGRERLDAFPVGTQIFYEITQKWHDTTTGAVTNFTTGTLMAFNPTPNEIYCHTY
jgi:hypothetical protein